MARHSRTKPRGGATSRRTAALVVCGVLTLAGCGSVTTLEVPKSVGAGSYANADDVLLRGIFVLGPPPATAIPRGGAAPLFLSIVNNSDRPDRLVRVSAPGVARSVTIENGGIDAPVRRYVGGGPVPQVMLTDLVAPLRGNDSARITFTFRHAGTATTTVPVETYEGPFTTFSPSPSPSATPKR